MQAVAYTTKAGVKQFRPKMTEAEFRRANEDSQGFCLACGADAFECEPDTRQRVCESCGMPKVYGIEELLVMELLVLE